MAEASELERTRQQRRRRRRVPRRCQSRCVANRWVDPPARQKQGGGPARIHGNRPGHRVALPALALARGCRTNHSECRCINWSWDNTGPIRRGRAIYGTPTSFEGQLPLISPTTDRTRGSWLFTRQPPSDASARVPVRGAPAPDEHRAPWPAWRWLPLRLLEASARIPCQSGSAGPPRIDPWMTGAGRVAAPHSVGLGRRAPSPFRSPAPCAAPLRTSRPLRRCPPAPGGHVVLEGRTSARRARVDCGRRRSRSWSSGGPGPRSGRPYPARHQLDAGAVVLIPPRALASPTARAPGGRVLGWWTNA